MPYQPTPDQELTIDSTSYHFAEHPSAPGMAYGQEGRQAVVYQLNGEDDLKALKVFKPRYRSPFLVSLADHIAPYASLPGLQVCQRTVLTPSRHTDILRSFPELIYAVLMPWVNGPVWKEIMLEKQELTPAQSLGIAQSLASTLLTMEERGLAHCDLSASNLILAPDLAQFTVDLVDVEDIYASGLQRPDALPAGSPGYAHQTAPQGLWSRHADRFAGAILLAEILGWCIPDVLKAAWGENYFQPQEIQQDCERFQIIVRNLRTYWGDEAASLLNRAWHSDTLTDCPTLGEWLVALPDEAPARLVAPEEAVELEIGKTATQMMIQADEAASHNDLEKALQLLRKAAQIAPTEMAAYIVTRIKALGEQHESDTSWQCPNCGQSIQQVLDLCPHCEPGRREKPVEEQLTLEKERLPAPAKPKAADWRCPHCGKDTPGDSDICPHCEKGRWRPESPSEPEPEPTPEISFMSMAKNPASRLHQSPVDVLARSRARDPRHGDYCRSRRGPS